MKGMCKKKDKDIEKRLMMEKGLKIFMEWGIVIKKTLINLRQL